MGRRTSGATENRIRSARQAAGLSQDALAQRAGITRQAVNAIESGRYVPNTIVAIKLARALGRHVEELFEVEAQQSEVVSAIASDPQRAGDRVTVGRVGDRLVAHTRSAEHAILEAFAPADGVARSGSDIEMFASDEDTDRTAFVVGCDPSLGILASCVTRRMSSGRLVWLPGSSQDALDALASATVHIAGIHLRDARTAECNLGPAAAALRGGGAVVSYASWEQGFVVARGNPKDVTNVEALTRPGVRFVNREPGAGSRTLLDQLLRAAHIAHARVSGYANVARSHFAVGRAIAGGAADAGIGLRSVAATLGLDFVPVADVKFDLLLPQEHMAHPAVETLLDVLQSHALRAELAALPGYDTGQTGSVRARFDAVA